LNNEEVNAAEAAVKMLHAHGVTTIFCLPGVQNDFFFNALYDHNRSAADPIRVVHTRHEQGAAYMALGYALATGDVGVFSVVPGPGLLNSTAALATAYALNAKVLCLTGQIPSRAIDQEVGMLHEIESQLDIIAALTKWSARANSPGDVPTLINKAFEEMHSGRPRPVGIEIPMDILPGTFDGELPAPSQPRAGSEISPALIDRAAGLLVDAIRPMIFVGGGAMDDGDDIIELAELLQAPVVSYRTGKGVIDDRHPLSIQHPPARTLWNDADVVLAIGTNMRVPLQRWAGEHLPTVIRIDVDPTTHDRIVSPDVAITARASEALPRLTSLLRGRDAAADTGELSADGPTTTAAAAAERPSRTAELDELRRGWARQSAVLEPQLSFLSAIREALGEDGILVDELTQVGFVARITWSAYKPRTFITTGYQGTLGYGFPTSLGVKVAQPGSAVVSINGDGGFMFGVQELATAVQHRIPVVAVVFNNNQYGNVQYMQKHDHGGRVIASDLHNPDFVALAESFGAIGVRAETPDDLGSAIVAARGRDLPTVVEVPVGDMPSIDQFR